MIMKDPTSLEEQNRVFSYLLKLAASAPVKGVHGTEGRLPPCGRKTSGSRIERTSRQVHGVLLVRVAPRCRTTATCTATCSSGPATRCRTILQRARLEAPHGPVELDGHAAQGGQRAARHLAQRQCQRRLDVPGRRRLRPPDGRSTPPGRPRATATSAWSRSSRGRDNRKTHPLLSPNDEFAGYELYQAILGLPANVGRIDRITGSYARQALKDGIAMQDVRGYNPYKFGMAGGSDSHNTGSPYRQDNFFGLHGDADGTVERRFAGDLIGGTMDVRWRTPAG